MEGCISSPETSVVTGPMMAVLIRYPGHPSPVRRGVVSQSPPPVSGRAGLKFGAFSQPHSELWGVQPEGSKSEGWGHGGSTAVRLLSQALLLILLTCGTAAAASQYSSSWGCCFSKEQREQAMPAAWVTWDLGLPHNSLRACCDQGASVTFGPTCLVLMADSVP